MSYIFKINTFRFGLVLCFMASISVIAMASGRDVSDYEFLTFNIEHPEQDAVRAIARGQPHCYSVNGYTKWFPGIETKFDENFCAEIERNISSTSDIWTPEHSEVLRTAIPYATAYNKYIVTHVQDKNVKKGNNPGP